MRSESGLTSVDLNRSLNALLENFLDSTLSPLKEQVVLSYLIKAPTSQGRMKRPLKTLSEMVLKGQYNCKMFLRTIKAKCF